MWAYHRGADLLIVDINCRAALLLADPRRAYDLRCRDNRFVNRAGLTKLDSSHVAHTLGSEHRATRPQVLPVGCLCSKTPVPPATIFPALVSVGISISSHRGSRNLLNITTVGHDTVVEPPITVNIPQANAITAHAKLWAFILQWVSSGRSENCQCGARTKQRTRPSCLNVGGLPPSFKDACLQAKHPN